MSEQSRTAFHRHLQSRGIPSELFQRADNGDYDFAAIEHDWIVWQAALATPPAQPVLAPVVREPLSDERIDQLFLDAHAQGYGMGWQECGRRFARAVIQATTGEQS